jgi:SAM-dependent methyltransferase
MRTSERHQPEFVESAAHHGVGLRHRFAYEAVASYAGSGARLLDVGCGEGYGATLVSPLVESYVGIDVAPDAIERATLRYGSDTTSFRRYDGDRLPFLDDSFDVVTSFQVIEHVEAVSVYVSEIRRVLRPGGVFLATTPNRLRRLDPGERPWNRYHLREFTPRELRDALAGAFETVQVFGVRGPAAMEQLELKRVERARRFARVDRFGLRFLLPDSANTAVRWLLRGAHRGGHGSSPFAVSDVRLADEGVEACFDLFAVAAAGRSKEVHD